MSFSPPPYPYERLDVLKKLADTHEGGPIDCSIGTPVDAPPQAVLDELAKGTGARGYPTSQGSPEYRASAAGWMNRRFGLELTSNDLAICGAALVLMLIPAIGSVYPVPDAPVRYFPYIFLGYLAIGGVRILWLRMSAPDRLRKIQGEIQAHHMPGALAAPQAED